MSITKDDIWGAIEGSLFAEASFSEDLLKWLDITGITGRYSESLSDFMINLVGKARLNEGNVDETIEQVKNHFARTGQTVGWMTSDLSTPSNINERLEAAGFVHCDLDYGMVLDDLNHHIIPNPDVTVRKASETDMDYVARLYSGSPEYSHFYIEWHKALKGEFYLAYLDNIEEPVSVASMFYYLNKPIVALQGAFTKQEYRRQGIYTSLIARRLDDARQDGMEAAILQAGSDSSGPIVTKLGFKKVLDMNLFMWTAPEEH